MSDTLSIQRDPGWHRFGRHSLMLLHVASTTSLTIVGRLPDDIARNKCASGGRETSERSIWTLASSPMLTAIIKMPAFFASMACANVLPTSRFAAPSVTYIAICKETNAKLKNLKRHHRNIIHLVTDDDDVAVVLSTGWPKKRAHFFVRHNFIRLRPNFVKYWPNQQNIV